MKTVDLSLDFDFFSREDVEWDWGHSEANPVFQQFAWTSRYSRLDVYEETDPAAHADLLPDIVDLLHALAVKNVVPPFPKLFRSVGVADSHRLAFDFFRRQKKAPDLLLNLDAHHDAFSEEELDCGNWLVHLKRESLWRDVPVHQVYPRWKPLDLDVAPKIEIAMGHWADYHLEEPYVIRNVFFCRSGAWVPPHHDPAFVEMAQRLLATTPKGQVLEPLTARKAPDRAEADAARAEYHAVLEKMKAGSAF